MLKKGGLISKVDLDLAEAIEKSKFISSKL